MTSSWFLIPQISLCLRRNETNVTGSKSLKFNLQFRCAVERRRTCRNRGVTIGTVRYVQTLKKLKRRIRRIRSNRKISQVFILLMILIQHDPTSILLPLPLPPQEGCTLTLHQRFYATDIQSLTHRRKKRAENE